MTISSVLSRNLRGILKRNITPVTSTIGQTRSGYIILLPEVDPEIAEKLFVVNDELPKFSGLTAAKIGMVMGKHILDHECTVRGIDRELQDIDREVDIVNDILDPIEKAVNPFLTICGIAKTLHLADRKLIPARTYFGLSNRAESSDNVKFVCQGIYDVLKDCDKSKLTEEQSRLVDKYVIEGTINGLGCKTERYKLLTKNTLLTIWEKKFAFRMRVETANSKYRLILDDPAIFHDFPDHLIKRYSINRDDPMGGPFIVSLNWDLGNKFLEYCPVRDLRWCVWNGQEKAASNAEEDREHRNSVCLEEIRFYRLHVAINLELKTYMDIAMKTKMAESCDYVKSVLKKYIDAARPAQYDEVMSLQEYADERGFEFPIQIWDLAYWSRKQKITLFNFDDEKWRPYFPLSKVMNGLFELCHRLFGLRFQEIPDVDKWHPDVRCFHVFEPDTEKPVAAFYFDPYYRNTKTQSVGANAHVVTIRPSSMIPRKVMPITSLIMNLPPPKLDKPSLLSFSEVRAVFSKFGENLQCLLSKTAYSDISGRSFVEYDASEVCSNFMERWLYEGPTFNNIHGHYETGEKLENINLEGLRRHMIGTNLSFEIYKANMDILMHSCHDVFWLDISRDIWDDHFIFPQSLYHSDPCRYLDIFFGNMAGGYYSHIWSNMLVADIYSAFMEKTANHVVLGDRFRDTFLTFGGGCHAGEVFRRFRGRDPNPDIYLESVGLISNLPTTQTDPENDPGVTVAV